MERRLITAALPYVNNIPHLGNIIQDLSGDAFARYCRLAGYETLYVCGTDEYGTATETKALEEGITPRDLCDRYHAVHADIYRWFDISFDRFGRTSVPVHTEITQHIFLKLHENGYIVARTLQQPYCERCQRFLADRYVLGTCPHCRSPDARGDQCERCGKLLDPSELVEPRCSVCGSRPVIRESRHLFIDLMKALPKLRNWIEGAAERGFWARNAVQMTYAWMRDGLKERCITRDLKWGIPVPLDGYRDKVFYVWFDAPIGYISITAEHTPAWKRWWMAPKEVKLYQFVGKDNIPFHTVIFPSSLLGTGEDWTTLHHMSSTEFLNYEGGKFSKSRGIGVFGTDARETGIPVDVWRFYIFYNRPERSDFDFTWKDFQEKINAELIGNLANLVNRTLQFVQRFYDGRLRAGRPDAEFWKGVRAAEEAIGAHFERVELRDAFRATIALSSLGNKRFQDGEPWKGVKENPEATADLIWNLAYLVRDLAILVSPFLPGTAERIARMLGLERLAWADLGRLEGITSIGRLELLFARLEDTQVAALRERFSGAQAVRQPALGAVRQPALGAVRQPALGAVRQPALGAVRQPLGRDHGVSPEAAEVPTPVSPVEAPGPALAPADVAAHFRRVVDLRAAKIVEVARHPKADKLYIETIDLGTERRQIVSGLVPYYREEELAGHTIVLVANLMPAKLRGVESNGMLLAAQPDTPEGAHPETVEVLFVDHAAPGDRVVLAGDDPAGPAPSQRIDVDTFFSTPMRVEDGEVRVGGVGLTCAGRSVRTAKVAKGRVQ
jgi:methionyl-tRNA synthetase